jgi:hypothetical protein
MRKTRKRVKIYGSVVEGREVFPIKKRDFILSKDAVGKPRRLVDVSEATGKKRIIDLTWFLGASEKYNISSDLRDYIIVPVPLVTSDIPNRNMQGFTGKVLMEFAPEHGCLRYQTFVGKPTFVEHNNGDVSKAKGVNLDSSIVSIPKYKVAVVNVLSAFDRTKDKDLCSDILKKKRNAYSMGATATYFKCSVCDGVLGPGVPRTCICQGTNYTDLKTYGSVRNGMLHYILGMDPVFIENSSVAEPADTSAVSYDFI